MDEQATDELGREIDAIFCDQIAYPILLSKAPPEARQILIEMDKCLKHYGVSWNDFNHFETLQNSISIAHWGWLFECMDEYQSIMKKHKSGGV